LLVTKEKEHRPFDKSVIHSFVNQNIALRQKRIE
jgi:hypothetical protein